MENRPGGRDKHVTGPGKGVYRRGEGLHTGPVGRQDGYQGRKEQQGAPSGGAPSGGGGPRRSGGGRSPLLLIILAAVLLFGGGGAGLSGLLGGGSSDSGSGYTQPVNPTPSQNTNQGGAGQGGHYGSLGGSILSNLLGGSGSPLASGAAVSTGWSGGANTGRLNTDVAAGARAKRTQILGGGRDTVTLMVYMCGTDLESRNRMGTMDLQEMLEATTDNDKLNILVYTGGCRQWQNNVVSSAKNQLYRIRGGRMELLGEESARPMTDPDTLVGFLKSCAQLAPANRNMLIFWDHGGGSLSGYRYDEKYASSGSMSLSGIDRALGEAGLTYDFIGFDACLMATLETALMLEPYADYLIASEETEPGVGWYYTNWLTALNKNTSISTLEIGKAIVDDFVAVCGQRCRGQSTTLSVVDLAELTHTVPERLKDFAAGTSRLLQDKQFQAVSNARSGAREFASANKIDQVDLVHLAYNLNTAESRALADALLGAVKYNRTSANMTNAYGLSIYFPYQRTAKVSSATATYQAIGMDSDYLRCIQQFASLETGGQAVSGGASSPLGALLGGGVSGSSSGGQVGMDAIMGILGTLMNSGASSSGGYFGRALDLDSAAAFIADNQLCADSLVWTDTDNVPVLRLSEDKWALVQDLQLNVFYDDGEGYIDLGLDNVCQFTDDGALLGAYDGTWLAIDDQPVAYYYTGSTVDGESYTITGRVPVLLNGQRANLLLVFDNEHPYGAIVGACAEYAEGETEVIAKSISELSAGDTIDFVCDYYSYDGDYQDSYLLGEQLIWRADHQISNVDIGKENALATYLFTDIYCQEYWTPTLP